MKIVIGDLHGQTEVVRTAANTGKELIFVGDYFDSYNRLPEDCHETFLEVLKLVKSGQAIALRGNHEMSYLNHHLKCSGWNFTTSDFVAKHFADIEDFLLDYTWAEGFLISHAGVSQWLLDGLDIALQDYLDGKRYDQIGSARGGYHRCGGLWWCDWDLEFTPIEGVNQIVGHTHDAEIRNKENNWCIDALNVDRHRWNVLLIEDDQAQVVDLRNL
jgi:hypothetical protein